jgi:hypothetical protein
MTFIYDTKISYNDSPNLTAFSRLRTADARLLGEYRYMYGSGASAQFNDKIVGSGTLVADHNRNCFLANVGTSSGDRVVRQSKQYHPYIAGTSNLGFLTFTLNSPKANVSQSVGLFDDYNGIFFRMNGTTPQVVIRKCADYTTANTSEQIVDLTNWNIERFDGSMDEYNQSGITIDWTKSQILVVDYQWLGVGRVRVGFVIDGIVYYCHQFTHSNKVTEVYMHQPSLPCRWEIENKGISSSNSQLMVICGSVYCEGADLESGFTRSTSTDGTLITLTANTNPLINTAYGVLGIRLKNTLVNKPNHSFARLKDYTIVTDQDVQYKLVVLPGKSYLANANTVFTSVPGYGWCEYITNFALNNGWDSANEYTCFSDGFATGSQGNKSGAVETNIINNITSSIYQNYDSTDSQILALIAYRISGVNTNLRASMNWIEIK